MLSPPPWNLWPCLESFLVATISVGGSCCWCLLGRGWVAAKYRTVQGTAPTANHHLSQMSVMGRLRNPDTKGMNMLIIS